MREPEAAAARTYLTERNFDGNAAVQFGCGFAPGGWDTMTKHLLRKGFEFKELEAAGLSKQGKRGPIDRFHRRLTWPIRNLAGDIIGFGARKLFDDDTMPGKYVNTPETVLYKKSQVLFGLDLAKREIAKSHQAVVVEGYTDVMAMHLAGVKTAVAACGTAFGEEHLAMLRRLLMDDNFWRGEIIYTFDGDAAGQAAAMKAFAGDQNLAGQTYLAVAPDGQDPCELRQGGGDAAVRDLVARRVPLFEFVVKGLLAEYDLDTAEGQVEVLRRAVPVVAKIKDDALRKAYATRLAGWVGWDDIPQVIRRVGEEAHGKGGPPPRRAAAAPFRARTGDAAQSRRSGAAPAAQRAQVGAAVPSDRGHGVRLAPAGIVHPPGVRGGALGDRGGRRDAVGKRRVRVGERRRGSDERPDAALAGDGVGCRIAADRNGGVGAALHHRGVGAAAGGVGRAAGRGAEIEAHAHLAGGEPRRIPRALR